MQVNQNADGLNTESRCLLKVAGFLFVMQERSRNEEVKLSYEYTKTSVPRLVYVSGGCRSGKSAYAQRLAEGIAGRRAYLATCPRIDVEMDNRILLHQQQRADRDWETIEEPVALDQALLKAQDFDVILIDCLTLWVNNLLFAAEQKQQDLTEADIEPHCQRFLSACRQGQRTIIVVSNEVGMGLVPEDPLSRRYRDLIGRCNQLVASAADEAIFMVSGLPLRLK